MYVTCTGVTPGAVEFYLPGSACFNTTIGGDTYVFSGYQYDWISVYQAPGNVCGSNLGAASNSAYIGLVYAPSAPLTFTSPYAFEVSATAGVIGNTLTFTGSLPSINYNPGYAPVPPATRLVS